MRAGSARVASLVVAACAVARVVASCAVDDLEIAGKRCPCVAGYVCDPATATCVTSLVPAVPEAGTVEEGGSFRDAPRGGFVVRRFEATWQASRSVRWDWEVTGDAPEFAEYQLVVGATEDAVLRQDSTSAVFDRRINPELGGYGGRDAVAPGTPAAAWTVTDRHPPARSVFARLIVRDTAGRENTSAVVSATTQEERTPLVLFADQIPDGSVTVPSDLKRVTGDCYSANGACLQIAKVACADAGSCTFELGLSGYNGKTVETMTPEQFANAFVEIAIRGGTAASPRPHSDLVLTIGAPSCRIDGKRCRFRYHAGWSFRPGAKEFRLVQVPLRLLQLETPAGPGPALRLEDLAANGFRIEALTVSGEWTAGATLTIDHLFIRW